MQEIVDRVSELMGVLPVSINGRLFLPVDLFQLNGAFEYLTRPTVGLGYFIRKIVFTDGVVKVVNNNGVTDKVVSEYEIPGYVPFYFTDSKRGGLSFMRTERVKRYKCVPFHFQLKLDQGVTYCFSPCKHRGFHYYYRLTPTYIEYHVDLPVEVLGRRYDQLTIDDGIVRVSHVRQGHNRSEQVTETEVSYADVKVIAYTKKTYFRFVKNTPF